MSRATLPKRVRTGEDVALAGSDRAHVETIERWARTVRGCWAPHHTTVANLVSRHVILD